MQALMLPEAVRLLHLLVANGKRVYVHCTAGINRATLTTVGYLTFVKVRCCVLTPLGFASLQALLNVHSNCAVDAQVSLMLGSIAIWQETGCMYHEPSNWMC